MPIAIPDVKAEGLDPQIAAEIHRSRLEVSKAPMSDKAWGTLGAVLYVHRFYEEALPCLVKAENLKPDEPRWPHIQGLILSVSDPENALKKFERSADLSKPELVSPRLRVVEMLLERGKLDEARKYIDEAAKAEPGNPRVILAQARLLVLKAKDQEALPLLMKCAEDKTTAPNALPLLAEVQRRLGNTAESEAAATKAAKTPPDSGLSDPYVEELARFVAGKDAWLRQAENQVAAGDLAHGVALLRMVAELYPEDLGVLERAGNDEIRAGDQITAEKTFRQWVKLDSHSSAPWFNLGNSVAVQGRYAEAAHYYEFALKYDPTNLGARYSLGEALEKDGDFEKAEPVLKALVASNKDYAPAYKELGKVQMRLRRFADAAESFDGAVKLDPKDAQLPALAAEARQKAKSAASN